MTTAPALPVKVRKARRSSTCPVCKGPIRVGQLIASCGGLWMCAACLIGHRHQLAPKENPA